MTKLIMHVKITILPMLGRVNGQGPGSVKSRQLSSYCKYQTIGNGGLEWDNMKENENK